METFKKGDKFIHFTKYGGVNVGEVLDLTETIVTDTVNCCFYVKHSLLTTKGIFLNLDGSDGKIYRYLKPIPLESNEKIKIGFKKLKEKKHRPNNKLIHIIDENKKT
jgi:hypothetical protein